MRKNVAKTLVYVQKAPETTSVDIETYTSLRQPEVSIAMQELRDRGWVEKRDIKKKGKGRPVHAYRLAKAFPEIIDAIEEDEKKRVQDILENVDQLRSLFC
ncbi:MAG: ArsR family transcriptional regulator [Candidatus Methanomethylophilaceae archaeon]